MSDVVDIANANQQIYLDHQIRQSRIDSKPTDTTKCIECGQQIASQRKQALPSTVLCFDCAEAKEKQR